MTFPCSPDEAGTAAAERGSVDFHIVDMATLPEHQGRGLGRRVLTDLLAQIEEVAPDGPYVTLMADAPGRPLYASTGFVETAPTSLGMLLER